MENPANDPRLDPDYAAYYYLHSRLDPRLPPPIYSPGQSWSMWAPPSKGGKDVSNPSTPIEKYQNRGFGDDVKWGL